MAPKSVNVDLHDLPRILWYRRWIFFPAVVLVTLASVIIALLLPNIYEATSTIVLEQKAVAESSIGSNAVTPDIEQRLRIFRTLLMSEYLLQKVIAHLKLVPNMYDPLAVQEKIEELRQGITVRIKGTDSLQVSYQGADRQMVMRITNELGNFFIEDTLRYVQKVMEGTSGFLKEGLEDTEKELKAQEQKMLAFKGQHLKELPDGMDANQRALDRLSTRLEGIDQGIRDLGEKRELTQSNMVQYEWYPDHPQYRILKKQVEQYDKKLQALKSDRADLLQKIKEYEAQVERAPEREQEWTLLTRGYDVLKERYRALMNKHLDAQLSLKRDEFQKMENIRVLDPATLPLIPVRPNRYLIVAIGCIAGLALGLGGVFLAEMSNPTARAPTDLQSSLRVPLLACIPDFGKFPARRAVAALPGASEVPMESPPNPALVMLSDPYSVPAEQYRHLRTSIRPLTRDKGGTVLMVTSSLPSEGKSVTAANLAMALAFEMDHEVLLVDAELRCPAIHKLFGLNMRPGLADVLSRTRPGAPTLQQGPVDRLTVLCAGEARANPADLINPRNMAGLLSELRRLFTCIIVDSPPILPVADACLLASCTDGVIIVARAGVTRGDVYAEALHRLGNGKALGIVFNAVDPRLPGYRSYHYYGYGRYGTKRPRA